MFDSWPQLGSNAIAALFGGLVAGYFALAAARRTHQNDLAKNRDEQRARLRGFLQSVHDEIETLLERYQDTMGARLETLPDGQPLLYYYPLVNDFFSVYNGNTHLLGHIEDPDLRRLVVRTYTLSKSLVDSYRMNNDMIQKFEYWSGLAEETKNDIHDRRANAHYARLTEYAKSLKQLHALAKQSATELLRRLQKEGVLSNVQ